MALSKKLNRILRSKTNLTDTELNQMTESEGWAIVYGNSENKDLSPEICFTGFSPSEKENLETFAKSKGLKVVKSITKRLNYLCCGDNPGPSKIEKAEKQDVLLINKQELIDSFSNESIEINQGLVRKAKSFVLNEKSRKVSNFFGIYSLKVVFEASNQSEQKTSHVNGSVTLILENKELIELTVNQNYTLNPNEKRQISFKFPLNKLSEKERSKVIENYKILQFKWIST